VCAYSTAPFLKMKTFTIGDIHGNYKALSQCLQRSQFNYETDRLIVLGDIVDGFSQTYEVVEELLKVKDLIFVIGNHDSFFLDFLNTGNKPNLWVHQGGYSTLYSYNKNINIDKLKEGSMVDDCKVDISIDIPQSHKDLFNKAVLFHIQDDKIFVHGGFDDRKTIYEQTKNYMMWDRRLIDIAHLRMVRRNDDQVEKEYWDTVFVGHTTTQKYNRITEPIKFNNLWMMDTGAGWNGRLAIMNIHTEEYWLSDTFKGGQR